MQMFYRPMAKDNVPRIYDSQGRDIAEAISKDDARLIAAAPFLLELLLSALPYIEEGEEFNKLTHRNLSKQVRAVIAEYLGE
jgi:hypothetical protein